MTSAEIAIESKSDRSRLLASLYASERLFDKLMELCEKNPREFIEYWLLRGSREIVTTHSVSGDVTTLEDLSVVTRLASQKDED